MYPIIKCTFLYPLITFKHLPLDILGMIPRRILDSLIIHVTSLQVTSLQLQNILKYLFPVPKEDSKRVVTFANQEDSSPSGRL